MNIEPGVIVSPRQVELNEVITIRPQTDYFTEIHYSITDESGKLVRKGAISKGINEFKLCIVGFKTGVYNLNMGDATANFTVL